MENYFSKEMVQNELTHYKNELKTLISNTDPSEFEEMVTAAAKDFKANEFGCLTRMIDLLGQMEDEYDFTHSEESKLIALTSDFFSVFNTYFKLEPGSGMGRTDIIWFESNIDQNNVLEVEKFISEANDNKKFFDIKTEEGDCLQSFELKTRNDLGYIDTEFPDTSATTTKKDEYPDFLKQPIVYADSGKKDVFSSLLNDGMDMLEYVAVKHDFMEGLNAPVSLIGGVLYGQYAKESLKDVPTCQKYNGVRELFAPYQNVDKHLIKSFDGVTPSILPPGTVKNR